MASSSFNSSVTLKTNNLSETVRHLVHEKIAANNANKQQGIIRAYFRRIWQYDRDKSLCCLPANNLLRKYAKKLVDWTYPFYRLTFNVNDSLADDRLGFIVEYSPMISHNAQSFTCSVILTIVANCVVLAMDVPLPDNDSTEISLLLERNAEIGFLVVFCIEAALKIIAKGFFFHPQAYLRSGWNILDFLIVVVGLVNAFYINAASNEIDVKILRVVRVLRPLKLVSGMPSLQIVLRSLLTAMGPLFQISLLVLFVIVIYSIIGMEFFLGKFHLGCRDPRTGQLLTQNHMSPCNNQPNSSAGFRCVINTTQYQVFGTCDYKYDGPNYGITGFDNIFMALLTVFQCISLEGWTNLLYDTNNAVGSTFTWFYFLTLIIWGSFFMLNLVLGVLSGEFAKERDRVEKRREYKKFQENRKIERDFLGYLEWIGRAEDLILGEQRLKDEETAPHFDTRSEIFQFAEQDQVAELAEITLSENPINTKAYATTTHSPRANCLHMVQRSEKFLRLAIRRTVKSRPFFWIVILLVFLNAVTIASEHSGEPLWLKDFREATNIVFVALFTLELILKLYGLGAVFYFSSTFNCFDFAVVIASIAELIVRSVGGPKLGISVFRCIRLLRIFEITKHWKSLSNLVASLISSLRSILSLLFLIGLCIMVFALLGMQLFGGRFNFAEGVPRSNFNDFGHAVLSVFQVLSGEDWNEVMYNGIRAYRSSGEFVSYAVSLYFVVLVCLGNYTLLNVFLAIAVDNLTKAQEISKDEDEEIMLQKRLSIKRKNYSKDSGCQSALGDGQYGTDDRPRESIRTLSIASTDGRSNQRSRRSTLRIPMPSSPSINDDNAFPEFCDNNTSQQETRIDEINDIENPGNENDDEEPNFRQKRLGSTKMNFQDAHQEPELIIGKEIFAQNVPILQVNSLFIFSPQNRFRRFCHYIVHLRHFENFMIAAIIISSGLLAVEDPMNEDPVLNYVLRIFDSIFTGIFLIELILKVVDFGFILHRGSYCRNLWNILDMIVVVTAVTSFIYFEIGVENQSNRNISAIKAIRTLRVLRPLKAIRTAKKLLACFQCMVNSLKNVLNVCIVMLLFLFMFAVIGVQLFKGKFHYCTDQTKHTKSQCRGNYYHYTDGHVYNVEVLERRWEQHPYNFDDLPRAMLTLFTMSTAEGPMRDYNLAVALYFCIYIVVFPFFFINIFVALIIVTFQEEGDKDIANYQLNRNQRDCIEFALNAKPIHRHMPKDKKSYAYKVWRIVTSTPFEFIIMVLIIVNTIVLMMEYNGQSKDYKDMLQIINITVTILFTVEMLLKVIAFSPRNFIKEWWNIFDLIVVIGSWTDIIITYASINGTSTVSISFFRLFRAGRLIKLLRKGYTIRVLLWTFLKSFQALPYVGLLIGMLFFISAVLGMQLFGQIQSDPTTAIFRYNNFQTFTGALIVLVRCSTGENWPEVMLACLPGRAKCSTKFPDCGSYVAYPYFVIFVFLSTFLMLNLFVAVIMDNFKYLTRDKSILGPYHLDHFLHTWAEFDPEASGRIKHQELCTMLCRIPPPLGFGSSCPMRTAYRRLMKLGIPINGDNTIRFKATLFALIRTSLKIKVREDQHEADAELCQIIRKIWPQVTSRTLERILPQVEHGARHLTIGKIYAALIIYEYYKRYKKQQLREEDEQVRMRTKSLFHRFIDVVRTPIRTGAHKDLEIPTEYPTKQQRSKHFHSHSFKIPRPSLRRSRKRDKMKSKHAVSAKPSDSSVSGENNRSRSLPGLIFESIDDNAGKVQDINLYLANRSSKETDFCIAEVHHEDDEGYLQSEYRNNSKKIDSNN
ncbi:Voltage-dependent L-type calcium channel subunit alpha-1C [Trichoplax sp. H2]|nr:Voltage-dependent L-type calcium channel subunit alpha-1C [Trichoplax sp. H2]|eukprot:RDD43883.1 Voltage-dependent L-type calcium channel subunit alpha-1C [Trichoplax sp. H2]